MIEPTKTSLTFKNGLTVEESDEIDAIAIEIYALHARVQACPGTAAYLSP